MARSAQENYDRIKGCLDKLHEAYPESPLVNDMHAVLGDAWDDYRAEHGDGSDAQANRSGGGDKTPPDPNNPNG